MTKSNMVLKEERNENLREQIWICCLVTQLCQTLCEPMNCNPPGSSVHGISQARILKWVAISFSKGSFWPRNRTLISCIGRWIHIMSNQAVHMQTAFNARMVSPHVSAYTHFPWTMHFCRSVLRKSTEEGITIGGSFCTECILDV